MKEFQSVFRNELEEYLKINQGIVNEDTLRNTRRVLLSFDSSLAEENTNVISEAAVNRWIREIRQTNAAKTVSDKVSYLRKFLRYLQYKGYRVFMPDCPKTSDSYVPIYLFRRGNTNPSGPRRQLGRQTYRPENLSDRHGVLYAAADAPWVRVPAG